METADKYISANDSLIERNTMMWGIFLVGLVIGFVGVYLVAAQPMFAQLDKMQRQVVSLQNDMESLVGVRDQAWETSNLLSGLNSQQRQLADARATLKEIRNLRQDLQVEAGQISTAYQALAELKKLKVAVLDQKDDIADATHAAEDLALIQKRLIEEHGAFPKAEATLADLDRTKVGLDELLRLKALVLEQGADAITAQSKAAELISLKETIQTQANIADAKASADGLIAMKELILAQKGNTDAALARLEKLFLLQDDLTSKNTDMTVAFSTLESLGELKTKVLSQTATVGDAMQNLEILSDFQQEFAEQINQLGKMRQNLMEIVMLESTIGRVAKIIEPLVQIGNVRRLSEPELRDAARVILEKRSTRISAKPEGTSDHVAPQAVKVPEPMTID